MINALSIDVEDYFHVTAFDRQIRREEWGIFPGRVVQNTQRIFDLLDEFSTKATFFVLGWVAERTPSLVKAIGERGHQVACHGYGHELLYRIGPARFRDDIRKAKCLLEDITGTAIRGYRAPSYSITESSLWALEILIEEGFCYDSSVFPIRHDIYGVHDAYRFPHQITTPSGTIYEFPLSTIRFRVGSKELRIPVAGGGYLRLFPAPLIVRAIQWINHKEQNPAVVYFHPWEIDPEQPRIRSSLKSRSRHYLNLHRMEYKIRYLMERVRFDSIEQSLSLLGMGFRL